MNETTYLSTTRVSKTLDIQGYILDSSIVQKIDEISRSAVSSSEVDKKLEIAYWITDSKDKMLKFEKIDLFLKHVNSESTDFANISFQYVVSGEAGINIEFTHKGKVNISAYGNAPDFQFNIDRLLREIQKCEQEYNWFVKNFILKRDLPRLLLGLVFGFSWLLLYSIGYYFYARNVGINIDPAVIPNGNEYYHQVEDAIRSDDLAKKMDVLLLAQLKGFVNVQDILQRQQAYSTFSLVGLTIVLILYFFSRFVVKLYPLAFFDFEPQKKILANIYRKRDIVWVGIVIGFIVNVLAGLAIAFLD